MANGVRITLEVWVPDVTHDELQKAVTQARREFFENADELGPPTPGAIVYYLFEHNLPTVVGYDIVKSSAYNSHTPCGHPSYKGGDTCAEMVCWNYDAKRRDK